MSRTKSPTVTSPIRSVSQLSAGQRRDSTSGSEKVAQPVAALFQRFDVDDDGVITKREFTRLLTAFDKKRFNSVVINNLFVCADTNGCGQITYEEFAALLSGVGQNLQELTAMMTNRRPALKLIQEGFSVMELRSWGYTLEELSAANCSVKAFRHAGFTALELKLGLKLQNDELIRAGFSVPRNFPESWPSIRQLRVLGYPLQQLRGCGFPLKDLYDNGYTMNELREVFTVKELRHWAETQGYSIAHLQEIGFTSRELRDCGYNLRDLYESGFSVDEMKAVYSPQEFRAWADSKNLTTTTLKEMGFSWHELQACGYTLQDLYKHGFGVSDLKMIYTAEDLRSVGISAAELRDHRISMEELRQAGYPLVDLRDVGCAADQAKRLGFSPAELSMSGYPVIPVLSDRAEWPRLPALLQELQGVAFEIPVSARELEESGYSIEEVQEVCSGGTFLSVTMLKSLGYNLVDLRTAGFQAGEISRAGFGAKEMRDAGFTVEQLKGCGFQLKELRADGVSVEELKTVYSAEDLRGVGVSIMELRGLGLTIEALKSAGFSLSELRRVGCLATHAKLLGFSPRELAMSGYAVLMPISERDVWPSLPSLLQDLKGVMRSKPLASADLHASGFSQVECLEVCSGTDTLCPRKLRELGYTMSELRAAGFSAGDLRSADFSAEEVRAAGFGVENLRDSGFELNELYNRGFTVEELREVYSPAALRDAGVHAEELKELGLSMEELRKAGFALEELRTVGCEAQEAKCLGFAPRELAENGFLILPCIAESDTWPTIPELLQSMKGSRLQAPLSYDDLLQSGYTEEEIGTVCNGGTALSVQSLRQLGYELLDLRHAGFHAMDLRTAGYSVKDMLAAGFSVAQLQDGGFSLQSLYAQGLSARELLPVYSPSELRAVGMSAVQLRREGLTIEDLRQANFSLEELHEAGCLATEAKVLGFSPLQLNASGFAVLPVLKARNSWPTVQQLLKELKGTTQPSPISAAELYASGFSHEEIYEVTDGQGCLSVRKLQEFGYELPDLRAAGFLAGDLCGAGFTAKEMRDAGFTAREVMLSKVASS